MKVGSLCTGYGGLDMAAQAVFGGELVWWSDVDPGPIKVMSHHRPDVPNIGDLKTAAWDNIPPVDILTAGYPCQPFSNAGKRLGTEDPRHLWPWIARAVGVLRPRIILLENVAAHLRRGFDVVSEDLAELGYDTAWAVVRASDVGAPHQRKRLFVVAADASSPGWREGDAGRRVQQKELGAGCLASTNPEGVRRDEWRPEHEGLEGATDAPCYSGASVERWGEYATAIQRWERTLGRVAPDPTVIGARGGRVLSPYLVEWMMGLPEGHVTAVEGLTRNSMLKLLGNGVVPQQAATALRYLNASRTA